MGYTTEFKGSINISPFCPQHLVEKVNDFCGARHGDDIREHVGCPSIWCDYEVSSNGTKISWNGSEKSYAMDKWLPILIEKFFEPAGCVLNGELQAFGEDSGDVWKLCVKDNVMSRRDMPNDW